VVPVLSLRTALFQEKSMCQISFDQNLENQDAHKFDMNKMSVINYNGLFKKTIRKVHKNFGIYYRTQ